MNKRNRFACLVAAGHCSLSPLACHAGSGTVELRLAASMNAYAVEMGESTVTATVGKGKVTFSRSSGAPFSNSDVGTVELVGFSKTQPSGLELEADGVATFSGEDTLLLLFQRTADDLGTSGEGNLLLAGGTGRFVGVDGHCRYFTDPANVTVATCEWVQSYPYR